MEPLPVDPTSIVPNLLTAITAMAPLPQAPGAMAQGSCSLKIGRLMLRLTRVFALLMPVEYTVTEPSILSCAAPLIWALDCRKDLKFPFRVTETLRSGWPGSFAAAAPPVPLAQATADAAARTTMRLLDRRATITLQCQ